MASEPAASLRIAHNRFVSFAMHQNYVPLVQRVAIENTGSQPTAELEVELWTEPAICRPLTARVAPIPAGNTYHLPEPDLPLSPTPLQSRTERERGRLRGVLRSGETVLDEVALDLDVLAYNEWPGPRALPEILAAFVLPNHPAVAAILRAAGRLLGERRGDSALTGYRDRDPERVSATLEAIYDATCALDLGYVGWPASYEETGQRIRTPDQIAEEGLATCLDLATLLAACFEQAGLAPVLVLQEGHAMAGAWLVDESFATAVVHEGRIVKKRADLGLLAVLETTLATRSQAPSFAQSCDEGRRRLEDLDGFEFALDIASARRERIRPLPIRLGGEIQPAEIDDGNLAARAAAATAIPRPGDAPVPTATAEPELEAARDNDEARSRLEVWKHRLLDLSLRNRLLHYRPTKATIPLLCPDPAALEDALASGKSFQIAAAPDSGGNHAGGDDPRDAELYLAREGEDPLHHTLAAWMAKGRLHAQLDGDELELRLTKLYRDGRHSLEEGGANILHLAIGFLEWRESAASRQVRRAPILLLPLELVRPSMKSGFKIRLADDDPKVNVTLLQKLSVDFGIDTRGLEELETDDSGVDVGGLLDAFRRAVLDFDDWDVTADAAIGLFSFTKFLMWRDLEESTELLMENAVVRHLIEQPDEPFGAGAELVSPGQLDERDAEHVHCPLDADSSQLAAVLSATGGNSFVLQGPPGTGKSQTITNLIAQALSDGKRVLFVSEKMAALNVVYRRLSSIGLAPFCLELHSSKARKRQVLDQLGAALDADETRDPERWRRTAHKLEEVRAELNAYCRLLHTPRRLGLSPFQAVARALDRRTAPTLEPALDLGAEDAVDRERYEGLQARVEQLVLQAEDAAPIAGHPFRHARCLDWSHDLDAAVQRSCLELEQVADRLREAATGLGHVLDADLEAPSLAALKLLARLVELLRTDAAPRRALLDEADPEPVHARLREAIEHGRRRDALADEVGAVFAPGLLELDLDDLRARLLRAGSSFFPLSWLRRRPVHQALRPLLRGGRMPRPAALAALLERAATWRDEHRAVAAATAEGERLLGPGFAAQRPDWDRLAEQLDWADATGRIWARLQRATGTAARWGEALAVEGAEREAALDELERCAEPFGALLRNLADGRDELTERLDLEPQAWGGEHDRGHLERIAETCGRWRHARGRLRGWTSYNWARKAALEGDLAPLVRALENAALQPGECAAAFERGFFEWLVKAMLDREPMLRQFRGIEHEHQIRRFRQLDRALIEMSGQCVFANLAARLPQRTSRTSASSEVGVLRRQLKKSRAHWPIRKLFRAIPNLLPRLEPCMLMSPLSVAQFLDPRAEPFDLVVFDEASQIPVWDAIGAIGRGREVVVVGDSRQLPPTTFFQRTGDGEDGLDDDHDDDRIDELESIIDECVAAQLPALQLSWHYRSRHESLIAFSNYHYYGNALLTFPSAADRCDNLGVSLRSVPEGVYDRAKTRANRAEADAVVAEIARRQRCADERSIGVVTFSQAQQVLIEDLLDQARRGDPELDAWLAREHDEPLFVKNLENVQGDERDVVLFSVCYGPDARGRVYMNFGPLNKPGGERRLNVAITRARQQVMVFSTLHPDQIDLSRTSPTAVGVRHLKTFLEYADRGPAAIAEARITDAAGDCESPFERDVLQALEQHGWDAHPQVGCSGYRIDLAVPHPAAAGRYVLGIECDGATYHSAKTARDRDRLRQGVLESLGWRLHRIWSTDWFYDRGGEIERLLDALGAALAESAAPEATGEPTAAAEPASEPPGNRDVEDAETPRRVAEPAEAALRAPGNTAGAEPAGEPGQIYRETPLPEPLWTPEQFHAPAESARLVAYLREVVSCEAPISVELLTRRAAAGWQIKRVTSRVRARVARLLEALDLRRDHDDGRAFVWRADQDLEHYAAFRVPDGDAGERSSEDIHGIEIANAAAAVLAGNISLSHDDLVRETARWLGFQRVGHKVAADVGRGVAILCERGTALRSGDHVVWCQDD